MHRLEQRFDADDAAAAGEGEGATAAATARRAARQLACGFGVGVFATCFNAPFDVVKSRFQAQLPEGVGSGVSVGAEAAGGASGSGIARGGGGGGAAPRYSGVFPTLVRIARDEGPRALYRGFVPKALRLGIGQTVGLAAFQSILDAAGVRERDAPAAARRVERAASAEIAAGG
jgi:solute carrier family 25 2-oxodicarboxylate transporter 21